MKSLTVNNGTSPPSRPPSLMPSVVATLKTTLSASTSNVHHLRICLNCSSKRTLLQYLIMIIILIKTVTAHSPIDTTSKSSNVKETPTNLYYSNIRADKLTSENSGNSNGNQCPYVCSCIWKGGKQTATCDRRSLTALPVGLDSGTQVIDLTGNALSILPPNVFLERGLINLQRIHLLDCSLVDISAEAFVKLSNLIELDLSNNTLTTVPSKSFAEAPSLRRLSLSGNRLREIRSGAFLTLIRLQSLDLSHNQLVHLDTDAFRGLRSLQVLRLESNQLQTLPAAETFVSFLPSKMASLALHDNRWRCDCHLAPLRQWITLNNVPLEIGPTCSAPTRLQDSKWNEIKAHEFACSPTIHAPTGSAHLYKHIGNNITLVCPVSGHPVPKVRWLFELPSAILLRDPEFVVPENDENNTESIEYEQQTLPSGRYSIVHDSDSTASHAIVSILTIHALQPEDSQRITCRAQNVGGVAQHNFTLLVSTQEPFSSSRSMDFIVTEMFVIFASIAVLLLILLVFVALFIARFKNQRRNNFHQDSSTLQSEYSDDPPAYRLEGKLLYPVVQSTASYSPSHSTNTNSYHLTNSQLLQQQQSQKQTSKVHHSQASPQMGVQQVENGQMLNISNGTSTNTTQLTQAPSSSSASSTEPASDFSLSDASTSVTLLNGSGTQYAQNASTNHPQNALLFTAIQNHQHSHLLNSAGSFYIAPGTVCDEYYGQYPLLAPLNAQQTVIYGTHGITPTAMIKPKVTFADQFRIAESDIHNKHAACTYGTLSRRTLQDRTASTTLNRSHRAISSYPEGFNSILTESSVDSACDSAQDSLANDNNIIKTQNNNDSITVQRVDETEEDDYYRTLTQGTDV